MKRFRALALLALLCWATPVCADLLPTEAYTTITKTDTSTSAQTATTLWTPATGKVFVLQGCVASATNGISVRFQVSGVDVIPPMYLPSYGVSQVGGNYAPIYTSSVADAVLTYTTVKQGANYGSVSVMCWGYERHP